MSATKEGQSRVPRGLCSLKATAVSPPRGEGAAHPAGCLAMARAKEDGPVTRETLIRPQHHPAPRRSRTPISDAPQVGGYACGRERKGPALEVGQRQGKTVVEADAFEGVGGLHTSDDVGEREGTRTRQSKGGPC